MHRRLVSLAVMAGMIAAPTTLSAQLTTQPSAPPPQEPLVRPVPALPCANFEGWAEFANWEISEGEILQRRTDPR